MTVSIIMRSKNSDWVIDQALAGLYSQTFKDFELLVVDSGSTDKTLDIVKRYPCRVIEIPPGDYFPGAVLNRSIREACGDILVFQNSDVVPLAPDSLARLLAAFEDPAVDAAFGRQIPRPEAFNWVIRDYKVSFPESGPAPEWMPFSLPLAAMRRSAWEDHPFYTEAWGSEDCEWGVWAKRTGRVVRYVPDAIVMHSHNYSLRELYGRRFIEGEADAFIHKDADSPVKLARRVLGSTLRDVAYHLKTGDLPGLVSAPVRRAVFHYGYFKGHKHGEERRRTGDRDASVGQRVVLEQYGGAGASEAR
jgi:rhamnosyltransferase